MTPSVDDALITERLEQRPSRAPDFEAECAALSMLADELARDPPGVLQKLAQLMVDTGVAESAGVSLLRAEGRNAHFRWDAAAGRWADKVGGQIPFDRSLCGRVIDHNSPLLFERPQAYMPDAALEPAIQEILLVPIQVAGRAVGTVWTIAHGKERQFDAEDRRFLSKIAGFASAAYQICEALDASREANRRLEQQVEERSRAVDRTYRELHESEVRYRMLFEAIDEGFCIIELLFDSAGNPHDFLFLEVNPAFERESGLVAAVGKTMRQLIPAHEDYWFEIYGRIAITGEPARFENRAAGLDKWFDVYAFRIGPADRRQVAVLFTDISRRRQAEAALRESELRLSTLVQGIPQLVWRAAAGGQWHWSSPQWTQFTGLSEPDSRGLGWCAALHPEDRDRAMEVWAEADAHGTFEIECRLRDQRDGSYRWFQTRASAVRDEQGRVIEWLGTCTDIDELHQLQQRQKMLVGELQHRTRNLIAVVSSISTQTLAASESLEAFEERFQDRLGALSRVQGLLSRADQEPITIGAVTRMELNALGVDGDAQVVVEGPEVPLRHSAIQIIALALHELATNARKHGALRSAEGRLSVTWKLYDGEADGQGAVGEPRLELNWVEEGILPPNERAPAARRSYGRLLIERALPYTLDARTSYELGDRQLLCTIDLPIARARGRKSA